MPSSKKVARKSPNEQPKKSSRFKAVVKNTTDGVKRELFPKRPALRAGANGKRLLQQPQRLWYKPLTWRYRPPVPKYKPLPKARVLFWYVLRQFWQNWRVFGGIALVYGILNLVLVRGVSGASDLSSFKSNLDSALHGNAGNLLESLATFGYLIGTSGSTGSSSGQSGVYQTILLVVCSLAYIWALRKTLTGNEVRQIRNSFYQGMYPLVPFALLFLLGCVQLVPMAIGTWLLSFAAGNGIAVTIWERLLFLGIWIALSLWSLRMITALLVALYVVTLPDMSPMRAYRSARQLVYRRRLLVWRKLVFLPFVMLILAVIIEVPLIMFLTPVAVWAFFVISALFLPLVHGYLYNLYREML